MHSRILIAAMLSTVSASTGQALQTRQTSLNGRVMTSSRDVKATLAEMLHQTVDGRGLVHSSQVPKCHCSINPVVNPERSGGGPNTASSFIAAIKVRGNLIGTALRSTRGRPQDLTACNCCGRMESLAHILQVCPRTHASCIAEHDEFVDLVNRVFTRKGYTISCEPAIPTRQGYESPTS